MLTMREEDHMRKILSVLFGIMIIVDGVICLALLA